MPDGAVTSAHPLASMAGIQTLLAGGIGLLLGSREGGERPVLDFIGHAPRAARLSGTTADDLAGGPRACATPGNLGGRLAALERFGSMPRAATR